MSQSGSLSNISAYKSMPNAMFNRDWAVKVEKFAPDGTKTDQFGNQIYKSTDEDILFTDKTTNQKLKVTFDIPTLGEGQSNKGIIEIWNLNSQSRKTLLQKGGRITLEAGYVGFRHPIFIGDIMPNGVMVKRVGPDIVTKIELGSFERNIEQSLFSKSYPSGTKYMSILADCAKSMSVDISVVLLDSETQSATTNASVSYCKAVKGVLFDICNRFSLDWSVQNGELQIKPKSSHVGQQAIVLNSGYSSKSAENLLIDPKTKLNPLILNTGLINIPYLMMDGMMGFTSLMNPYLMPGRLVQIISENVNGFFQIWKAHFVGDSHGEKWQVECEGSEVKNVQTLPNVATQLSSGAVVA